MWDPYEYMLSRRSGLGGMVRLVRDAGGRALGGTVPRASYTTLNRRWNGTGKDELLKGQDLSKKGSRKPQVKYAEPTARKAVKRQIDEHRGGGWN
jgi:hypothetical protein